MKQQKTSPEREEVLATPATDAIREPAISEPNEPAANAAIINDIKAMLADMRVTNELIAAAAAARVGTIKPEAISEPNEPAISEPTINEPTANATTHDDLQELIAELKEANALIAVDIRRAATEAEATEATEGEASAAAPQRVGTTKPKAHRQAKGNHRQAKQPKPITDEDRRMIDDWLEKLFDAPLNVHAMTLVYMPKPLKVYRLLHDAAKRGNWRASAIHLELTQPDRWAPKVENIIYADAEHSEKMFRKLRKAGVSNGKAK